MPEETLSILLGIGLGIGLSAACGFRVFVPLLIASLAAMAGWLTPAAGFEWLGTWPAVTALGVATVLEIAAYYIPWLDNLLDTISTPTAVVAGVLVTAACVTDMDPLLKWSLAAIVGGGSAGIVKGGMVALRALSSSITGGLGNALVSTGEWLAALALSIFAIVATPVAAILSLLLIGFLARFAYRLGRRLFGRREPKAITEKA